MSLWRLEWLRLLRTRRLVVLAGVYAFFGLLGPLTARYLPEIIDRFGGNVQVIVPTPTPADGISEFSSNSQQIGLLVVAVVAAGALVLDALPEMGIFLRTRVSPAWRLLVPRYLVAAAAAAGAFLLGLGAAWYETVILLGPVPVGALAAGAGYGLVYLAFAVAVVAALAPHSRSLVVAVAGSVAVLLALPLLGLAPGVEPWLPSHLLGALDALVSGESAAGGYLRATGVALAATAGLLLLAGRAVASKEL
jgi:ABC-2 type transport system permease protein